MACYSWSKTKFHLEFLIFFFFRKTNIKYGGSILTICNCVAASVLEWFAISDETMNSALHFKVLKKNAQLSVLVFFAMFFSPIGRKNILNLGFVVELKHSKPQLGQIFIVSVWGSRGLGNNTTIN